MRFALMTNNGWLSLQPNGSIAFRDPDTTPGVYETFETVDLDPQPAPTPAPAPPPAAPPPLVKLTEAVARETFEGVLAQFPELLGPYPSDQAATDASAELVRRTIWHLKKAGFLAGRQVNPSGAVSADKLCVYVNYTWAWVDLGSIGSATQPFRPAWQFHPEGGADPTIDAGIPD